MTLSVAPIEKGGSGRKFWRVTVGATHSHILVRYGQERPENRHYVSIAAFLSRVGVRVPQVYFHDESEGLILVEDAGETDLWAFRKSPWPQRRAHYQRTLDQALLLHTRAHHEGDKPELQQPFDAALYAWEQGYFIEHCLRRHFRCTDHEIADVEHSRLAAIANELAAEPRCLVHRDFQSQNIIIRNNEACLIDFQGLRYGLAAYDVASLLLDPYVTLTAAEREELLMHYLNGIFGPDPASHPAERARFLSLYDLCAMQRLMQALGAYGKLGHTDGRTHFLSHIPVALPRLREVLSRIPGLDALCALLARLS